MFQKKNQDELSKLSLKELTEYRKELMVRKAELLQQKKAGKITEESQAELEDLAVYFVTVDKMFSEMEAAAKALETPETKATKEPEAKATKAPTSYKPKKGEENLAVLRLTNGRRFNPETGKREAPVFEQKFNAGEYRLFMANYKGLGYYIEEVVYNPFTK